ncbi:MAG TPA: hypothetical protein VJX67_01655 [Blastocatellia bacterium]|nr:hypothetical protein [Blastocatellia bacterium]
MRRKTFVACIAIGIAILCMQLGLARPTAQVGSTNLVGSWHLALVPEVSPGPTLEIPGLATFTSDETAIATAGGVIVGPVPSPSPNTGVTPAHGIWQPSPAVGRFYIQLFGIVTNPDGTLLATRNFTTTVGFNPAGDTFTGTYSLEVTQGTVVTISSGTITGTRIPHPLLP